MAKIPSALSSKRRRLAASLKTLFDLAPSSTEAKELIERLTKVMTGKEIESTVKLLPSIANGSNNTHRLMKEIEHTLNYITTRE